jgi:hypothetical protein
VEDAILLKHDPRTKLVKFKITETPDASQWPIGTLMTLEQAHLLEFDAALMKTRSTMASAMEDQGFRKEIIREEGDWQPS